MGAVAARPAKDVTHARDRHAIEQFGARIREISRELVATRDHLIELGLSRAEAEERVRDLERRWFDEEFERIAEERHAANLSRALLTAQSLAEALALLRERGSLD